VGLISIVSPNFRDLTDADEPFTPSRADGIGDALQLLPPAAVSRLHAFMI